MPLLRSSRSQAGDECSCGFFTYRCSLLQSLRPIGLFMSEVNMRGGPPRTRTPRAQQTMKIPLRESRII